MKAIKKSGIVPLQPGTPKRQGIKGKLHQHKLGDHDLPEQVPIKLPLLLGPDLQGPVPYEVLIEAGITFIWIKNQRPSTPAAGHRPGPVKTQGTFVKDEHQKKR